MSDRNDSIDNKTTLLCRYFFNREDLIAVQKPSGDKPWPAQPVSQLRNIVRAHVSGYKGKEAKVRFKFKAGHRDYVGPIRLGSYTPSPDGNVMWACIDIDGPGHGFEVAEPDQVASTLGRLFLEAGLRPHLERSFSGYGWHIWIFFESKLPAAEVRSRLLELIPSDIPLQGGGYANASRSKGIEVFPKSIRAKPNAVGNPVWLPWYHNADGGANEFHFLSENDIYEPKDIRGFHITPATAISPLGANNRQSESNDTNSSEAPAPTEPPRTPFQLARIEILSRLELKEVYGGLLTGKEANGWLECRDPESPTGDQNPSAGVSDGSNGYEKGYYSSLLTPENNGSVFDFLEIYHPDIQNFPQALKYLAKLTEVALPKSEKEGSRKQHNRRY